MNKIIDPKYNWIFWLLFLPVALFAYYIPNVVLESLVKENNTEDKSILVQYVAPTIAAIFRGFVFLFVGTLLVPKYKQNILLILLCLLIFFQAYYLFNEVKTKQYFQIFLTILTLVCGVWGYFECKIKFKEK